MADTSSSSKTSSFAATNASAPEYIQHTGEEHSHKHEHDSVGHHYHRHSHNGSDKAHTHGPNDPMNADNKEHRKQH